MSKKEAVKNIFNRIARDYDTLNHLLSCGADRKWRTKALESIGYSGTEKVLDVACGTADFSIESMRMGAGEVIGIDISEKMVEIGRRKVLRADLDDKIRLQDGDCEEMPFADASFDVVTVAFGVRNFGNLEKGLQEIFRVLKPGGKVVILELSMPRRFPMKQLFAFYFSRILPALGGWLSGEKEAYAYLPASVKTFPQGENFLAVLRGCGFSALSCRRFSAGVASLYCGIK